MCSLITLPLNHLTSGISFLSAGEDNTMNVYLRNINFTKNMGQTASVLMFLQRELSTFPATFQVTIEDCTFFDNVNSLVIPDEFYTNELVNFLRFSSVVVFHNIKHENFIGNSLFKNNRGSNILLHSSVISLNGIFEFIKNYAINRAGLAVYDYSYVLFHEGTNVSFINNTARSRGGAIYVEEVYGIPSARSLAVICFFQYLSPRGNLDKIGSIDVHMYFANNSAGDVGNSIFSSQINRCSWVSNTAFKEVPPYNVTDKIVSFANPDRQQIASEPYVVCFCPQYSIQSRVIDCVNNSYGITIYPGETVHISVNGVGDYINSAQTIVYTTVTNESSCFINGSKLLVDQIPNTCTTLQYIVTSKISGNCTLNLWINDGDTSITAVYMKVLDCPFGFIPNENGVCDCHPLLISLHNPAMVINCNLTS